MKKCKKCNNNIPVRVKVDGITRNLKSRKYCLSCSPFGTKNRKKLELEDVLKSQKRLNTRQGRKETLVLEFGGKCAVCDYNRSFKNLAFHHLDPSKKIFDIGANLCRSMESVRQEAEKCILVCNNCHGEIHEGLILIIH